MRRTWLLLPLVLLAAVAFVLWMRQPRVDGAFVVLGEATTLQGVPAPAMAVSGMALVRRIATNAERDAEGSAAIPGTYSVTAWSHTEGKGLLTRRIRFKPGPFTTVGVDLVSRSVADGFGQTILTYSLRLEGALSADGSEHAFYLLPVASERRATSAVAFAVDYDADAHMLRLEIDEQVHDTAQRFVLHFTLGPDGQLARTDAPGEAGPEGPPAPRYAISGRVLDELARPQPGVRIEVRRDASSLAHTEDALAHRRHHALLGREDLAYLRAGTVRPHQVVARTVTDAAGHFRAGVDAPGGYEVAALPEAPWAAQIDRVWLTDDEPESEALSLVLPPGTPVHGRVQDADGRPVVAHVDIRTEDGLGWADRMTTGVDGAYAFPRVPAGALRLAVTLSSGIRVESYRLITRQAEPVPLTVPRGTVTLSGRVTSVEGQGVPGAGVTIHLGVGTTYEVWRTNVLVQGAVTDAEGRWALRDLPPGLVEQMVVDAEGYTSRFDFIGMREWTSEPLAEGATRTIDVTLARPSVLEGRVTRAADGLPLAGATVTLGYRGSAPRGPDVRTTDADGSYRFEGIHEDSSWLLLATHPTHFLPALEALLVALPDGDAERPDWWLLGAPPTGPVLEFGTQGAYVRHDLVLVPGHGVRGRVVDASGVPVAGAKVYVRRHRLECHGGGGTSWFAVAGDPVATSGADGSFVVGGLAPRADHVLFARHVGHAGQDSAPIDLGAGDIDNVTLRLVPGCVLRGRVLDADDQPLVGRPVIVRGDTTPGAGPQYTVTDGQGAFRFTSLPAQPLTVITRHGDQDASVEVAGLTVGELRDELVLRLPALGSVRGRTVRGGQPLAGCRVGLSGHGIHRVVISDAAGDFAFHALPPADYNLRAVHLGLGVHGETPRPVADRTPFGPIRPGATDVEIVVEGVAEDAGESAE